MVDDGQANPGLGAMIPGWTLEIVRGREALAAALTPERRQEWQALADEAKQVAVFQAPGFALTWYEVYDPMYEPLLLLGVGAAGHLVGIMPLAVVRADPAHVVFAGAEHCEYAGWLAAPGLEEEFPAACVARLNALAQFTRVWNWGWLAPGTGLGWLDHPVLQARGITGQVQEAANPILALQDPNRPRFFEAHGKNSKRKINRLRQIGEVRLVQFDSAGLTQVLFEDFMKVYDIRTLARYGSAPFTEDPLKSLFHLRLLERSPQEVLFFALMAGTTPVAFFFGLVDKRRAIYCLACFDQRFLAASPGKLLGDRMADVLRQRGLDYLDHTPGGDAYKEEAASAHEPVHRLVLFPSRRGAHFAAVRSAFRAQVKRVAARVGVSPARIARDWDPSALLHGRSPLGLAGSALRAIQRWACSKDVIVIYRYDRTARERAQRPGQEPDPCFRKDALEDFLRYTGSFRWCSRQEMMAQAIERLHRGRHCYTVVEEGVLSHFAWIKLDAPAIHLTEVDYIYPLPPKSAMCFEAYTDPRARGRGLHRRSLAVRLRDAFEMGAECVLTAIRESNKTAARNAEQAGYVPIVRITRTRRFGRSRWREEPVPVGGPSAAEGAK